MKLQRPSPEADLRQVQMLKANDCYHGARTEPQPDNRRLAPRRGAGRAAACYLLCAAEALGFVPLVVLQSSQHGSVGSLFGRKVFAGCRPGFDGASQPAGRHVLLVLELTRRASVCRRHVSCNKHSLLALTFELFGTPRRS